MFVDYHITGKSNAASSSRLSALQTARVLQVIVSEKSGQGMIYSPMLIGVVWITLAGIVRPSGLSTEAMWGESASIWLIGGNETMVDVTEGLCSIMISYLMYYRLIFLFMPSRLKYFQYYPTQPIRQPNKTTRSL